MIKDYWIKEVSKIKEFDELGKTEDVEILDIKQEISNLIDDNFITTATETGISRREKILKIQPFADDTLDTRRFRVDAIWNNQLPYTYRQLINKLNNIVGINGYILALNNGLYTLNIKINLGQKRMLQDVDKTVKNMVPANLVITVELQYNRHMDLAQFTHQQISAKTHAQLREEVL